MEGREAALSTTPYYHLSRIVSSRIAKYHVLCQPYRAYHAMSGRWCPCPALGVSSCCCGARPRAVLRAGRLGAPGPGGPRRGVVVPSGGVWFAPGLRAACGGRRPWRGPLWGAARLAPPASPRPPCAVRGPRWPSPICTRPRPCEGGASSVTLSAHQGLPAARSA